MNSEYQTPLIQTLMYVYSHSPTQLWIFVTVYNAGGCVCEGVIKIMLCLPVVFAETETCMFSNRRSALIGFNP